jgi:hypothetical protein
MAFCWLDVVATLVAHGARSVDVLDPELAAEALKAARSRVSPAFRGAGKPFGEEQTCPSGRTKADQLAAFLGRIVD